MLTPEYLLRISEGGEELASKLHSDILNRIIERIAKRLERGDDYILTAQDKWHIQLLQECGLLLEDIKIEIAKASKLMETEIAEAMEDAGVKAIEYDNAVYEAAGLSPAPLLESPQLIRLMQRTYEKTVGEWKNFTGTFADVVQQSFIEACDTAYSHVASGSLSYSQAYLEAIDNVVLDGPKVKWTKTDPVTGDQVVYHTDTLETATLRCIRTGVSQASGEITDARMEEMDWDIILVSSHLGARVTDAENYTNHYWWQGKFYSKSGKDKRFSPYSVCGPGHVQGIHGANCRHSHGPGDGEFNPFAQYDSEENQKEYELQQEQRELERRIRKSKQHVMGYRKAMECCTTDESKALAEEKYQREAALLQKRNKAYNDFCKENNLKKLNERLAVAKWDREQAAKARGAARKRINEVGEAAATSNWHTIPVAGGQTETKYRKIVEPKDIDQNVALTNPDYKAGGPGYRQNCQRCVPAYEMRRRGYDVIAKPAMVDENGKLSSRDKLYTSWDKVFKGTKLQYCRGSDGGLAAINTKMHEWGSGAVAEVMVQWKNSEAHVFVAEHINGTIRFIDPQTGNVDCSDYFTNAVNGATIIARIDNLEPTDLIEECIKNRGGKP